MWAWSGNGASLNSLAAKAILSHPQYCMNQFAHNGSDSHSIWVSVCFFFGQIAVSLPHLPPLPHPISIHPIMRHGENKEGRALGKLLID
jgi:hypothetical protein